MIIKRPETGDRSALTALWVQAFGDTEEFINTFFATGFSEMRCLLAEEEGDLLAALYWFDCLWNDKKIAYLYAIATDKNHRGKGICKQLMAHTHQALKEQGYAGAILVPAEESLEKFYGKLGYQTCGKPNCPLSIVHCPLELEPISVAEYRKLQKDLLPPNAVVHTDAAFAYLETFAKFYKTQEGICCQTGETIQERLPGNPTAPAMYLSLDEEEKLPTYFALTLA